MKASFLYVLLTLLSISQAREAADSDQPQAYIESGHAGTITALAASTTGKFIATAGWDHTINLWDGNTIQELRTFRDHQSPVVSIAFSPDSHWLASGSWDHTVRIWDVTSGACDAILTDHRNVVSCVQFSPSGAYLAAGAFDGSVLLWRTGSWKLIKDLRPNPNNSALIGNNIESIGFSPDESIILCGGNFPNGQKGIAGWRLSNGDAPLRIHCEDVLPNDVNSLHFTPDGNILVGCGTNASGIFIWDVKKNVRIDNDLPPAKVLDLTADGRQIVGIGSDREIWLSTLGVRSTKKISVNAVGEPSSVIFDPGGKTVLVAGDKALARYTVAFGELVQSVVTRSPGAHTFSISPDQTALVTSGAFGTNRVWNLQTGNLAGQFGVHKQPTLFSAFAPTGAVFVDACLDKTIGVYHWPSREILCLLTGHDGYPSSVVFSPSGRFLASTASDRSLRLWRTDSWGLVRTFSDFKGPTYCAAFSRDERFVAVGSIESEPRLYDLQQLSEARRFVGHKGSITALAFSPNGKLLATGGSDLGTSETNDRSIRLWDLDTGGAQVLVGHGNNIHSLAFSPDGNILASGDFSHEIILWDLSRNGQILRKLEGHTESVDSLQFSSTGRFLLSGSEDGTIRVWNPHQSTEVCTLVDFDDKDWIVFSPDGRFDTGDLDEIRHLHWTFTEEPLRPVSPVLYMRDYYEPRLLPRLLSGERLPEVRPLGDLNRVQPGVKIVSVEQGAQPDLAKVTVEVSPTEGEFQRDGKPITMRTDVYDLRLFRGGQLVGQDPELTAEAESGLKNGVVLSAEELNEWRTMRQVKAVAGRVRLDPTTGKLQRTFTVRLPHGQAGNEIEFSAYAFNEDRVKSEKATVGYKVPLDAGPVKRRAYVVTMGINAYENPEWDLRFAASDAKRMGKALGSRLEKQQYEVVPVRLISDYRIIEGVRQVTEDHAAREVLHAVLKLLAGYTLNEELKKNLPPGAEKIEKAEPDDLVMLTVSSHGYTSEEGLFYIVPSDSGETNGQGITEELRRKWISSDELSAWLRDVDAGDLVMIVDTCHSAATVDEPGFKPGPMGSRGLGQLAYDKGMRILAASQADDVALESEKLKQGLLTYALVHDGLGAKQAVKPGTNEITLESWLEYGSQRVPPLYQEVLRGKVQTFADGSKDVQIDADLSGESSSLKKPNAFQQPSLFNFQKNKQDVQLQ